MYLKRLEMHGFKTFAARTVLDFERGVTAVVGPNGSGKSNLADAVRWALGEQNLRHVRARHADDLIFAGAAGQGPRAGARPPMGLAEVMLTFDNGDGWLPVEFAEVRIGRRLYRTGEAEYLLNGARVRLRDITDLLARASISAGGHLIIGQGLIDTVLSLRPEERRGLVETLAGLRFYYSRRDDAESRLRTVEANLRHVEAMIAEAAPRRATLQEQADAYAQYHAVERALRNLLLLHYAHAHAQAREKLSRRAAELAEAQTALQTAATAVREAEQTLARTRERARLLGGQAGTLRGELRGVHEAREAAERELAVSRARRDAAVARLDDLRAGLPALEARRAEALVDSEQAASAARDVEQERTALHAARAEIERGAQASGAELAVAERAQRALAERRRALESRVATAQAELSALDREAKAVGGEEQGQLMDEQATAKGLREAEATLAATRQALHEAGAAVEQARAAESQARLLAADSAERARQTATARRDAGRQAEELRARAGGLRAWLQAAGGAAGTGQSVAALVVTEAESGPALAAALGPILAAQPAAPGLEADEAARALAAGARGMLLAGRVSLSRADQQDLEQCLGSAGVTKDALVGWGDALARIDASDESGIAIRDALSVVLVVRDLETAWRIHNLLREIRAESSGDARDDASTRPQSPSAAMRPQSQADTQPQSAWFAMRRQPQALILATLAGEALLPSGLLHHPAGEGAAALERASELREVEAQAEQAEQALRQATERAEQAEQERAARAAAAEAALRALHAAEHERTTRHAEVTAGEKAEAQARREAQWAAERRRRAAEATAARTQRRTEIERSHAEAVAALAALGAEEAPAMARYEATRAALHEATARRAEHGAALALVSERVADAQRRRRTAQESLARLDDDLTARRATLARLEQEATALEGEESAIAARAAEAARRIHALHERLRPLESEGATLEGTGADLEQRLAAQRAHAAQATAAHESAALALQRAEHELESVLAGIESDLALDPADLPPAAPPPPGVQGRVRTLRARLTSFGPVNARAPEDLAAVSERLDFLRSQSTDLRDGVARLRGLIAEANATVRERFGAVAGELDAQFRLYLQQLFGGGRGELTALYDEDGLPSGLEISVQPPGKKTRELALLSGGERALVGLALVFAMLAVRPVPFCVLDEAEAALDEANTLRVGEILRSLSARTQFIVVTHNRGTMSYADALYGVTMAETGVTQIAGLRLDEIKASRQSRAG